MNFDEFLDERSLGGHSEYTLTNIATTWNSRVILLAVTLAIGCPIASSAQSRQQRNKVELHRELSLLLEDLSLLEDKLGNIPTTRKQRKRLDKSITQMRRKLSRLMAVTPPRVRRFDATQRPPKAPVPAPQKVRPTPPKVKPVPPRTQVVPPKPKPVGPRAMGRKAFAALVDAVEAESFADGRMRVITAAADHHYFTVNQVVELLGKISFEEKKLKVVRRLYPKVVDPKNSFKLHNAFTFDSNKRKLRAILEN